MKRAQPTAAPDTGETDVTLGAHIARALTAATAAAADRQRDEEAARASLAALALAEGQPFLDRMRAEAYRIAEDFNGELGEARVTVRADGRTLTIADHRWSAYLGVLVVLPRDIDDPQEPYAVVRARHSGSGFELPWSFVAQDGALMVCRGHEDPLSAEGFTRAILGPWLTRLPMTPRMLVASIPSAVQIG